MDTLDRKALLCYGSCYGLRVTRQVDVTCYMCVRATFSNVLEPRNNFHGLIRPRERSCPPWQRCLRDRPAPVRRRRRSSAGTVRARQTLTGRRGLPPPCEHVRLHATRDAATRTCDHRHRPLNIAPRLIPLTFPTRSTDVPFPIPARTTRTVDGHAAGQPAPASQCRPLLCVR